MRRIVFEEDDEGTGGEQTGAAEWRALRLALTQRLDSLRGDLESAAGDDERQQLTRQVAEVRRQVNALATEEAVSQFVEDSERYVIASSTIREELSRDPDAEIA